MLPPFWAARRGGSQKAKMKESEPTFVPTGLPLSFDEWLKRLRLSPEQGLSSPVARVVWEAGWAAHREIYGEQPASPEDVRQEKEVSDVVRCQAIQALGQLVTHLAVNQNFDSRFTEVTDVLLRLARGER